jgi:hypothetical protein
MGQSWYRKSYDYLDGKENSMHLEYFDNVVSDDDDESDSFTGGDGPGATDRAKVNGEAMSDADMSGVAQVEETKSAIETVLENRVACLEAKVEKLLLNHDEMIEFLRHCKKILPWLVSPTAEVKVCLKYHELISLYVNTSNLQFILHESYYYKPVNNRTWLYRKILQTQPLMVNILMPLVIMMRLKNITRRSPFPIFSTRQ